MPSAILCMPSASSWVIPVTFQTGQSAEPLPSEVGRPMYADEVAMDFPNLVMVLTHTG